MTTHTSKPDSSVSAANASVSQSARSTSSAPLRLRQVEREHRQQCHLEEVVRRIDLLDRSKKGVDAEKDRQGERRNRKHQGIANLQCSHEQEHEREHQRSMKHTVGQGVVAAAEIGHDLDRRVSHGTEVGDLRQVSTEVGPGRRRARRIENQAQRVGDLERHVQKVVTDADCQYRRGRGCREGGTSSRRCHRPGSAHPFRDFSSGHDRQNREDARPEYRCRVSSRRGAPR